MIQTQGKEFVQIFVQLFECIRQATLQSVFCKNKITACTYVTYILFQEIYMLFNHSKMSYGNIFPKIY